MVDRKKREMRYADAKKVAEAHSSGERTTFKVPEGYQVFKVNKEGVRKFDILPYVVKKGSETPGGNPFADEGYMHYERTYWVHRTQGTSSKSYVCLKKTFGKKCPVCEYVDKHSRDPKTDQELIKALLPKQRQLFNVVDRDEDPDGKKKEVMIWEYSQFLFGKLLDAVIKGADEGDNLENFFHLEGGMTLKVTFEEKNLGTPFYEARIIEMKPRKDYNEVILDKVADLDDLLKELPYKKLEKIFFEGEEEEDETPVKNGKAPPNKSDDDDDGDDDDMDEDDEDDDEDDEEQEEDDEEQEEDEESEEDDEVDEDDDTDSVFQVGDNVSHPKHGKCTVSKVTGDTLTLKDSKGKFHKGVDPDECSEVKSTPAKKSTKVEDDDDDDDWESDDSPIDDDEDETPVKKKTSKKK